MKFIALAAAAIGLAVTTRDLNHKLAGIDVPSFSTESLSPAAFKALHAAVAPSGEGERWTEIPWVTDLMEARKAAAAQGKPLFMWIMDGHPLGCT